MILFLAPIHSGSEKQAKKQLILAGKAHCPYFLHWGESQLCFFFFIEVTAASSHMMMC